MGNGAIAVIQQAAKEVIKAAPKKPNAIYILIKIMVR